MKKQGQVTIFIVLGMILLITAGIFLYLNNMSQEDSVNVQPQLDEVPMQYKELQQYILGCVENLGTEAIANIAENGGYLDLTEPRYTGRSFYMTPMATDSDGVYLGSHAVPYYWYLKSTNDCYVCEMSMDGVPTTERMASQIQDYIDENMDACLGDFEGFRKQGFEIEKTGEPTTTAVLLPGKTVVQTRYEINADKGNTHVRLENFGLDFDAPLLDMYSLALAVTLNEANEQFLEQSAMALITSYSGLGDDRLPPLSQFSLDYTIQSWIKINVEEKIKQLLSTYIPLYRVKNTRNSIKLESTGLYEQAYFDKTLIDTNISMPDTDVNFIYMPDWMIHFDITPRKGQLLEPSSFKREFPFGAVRPIQTNHYEFFYDVSFPVVVEIRNDRALKGRGLNFLFALEGNLRDNKNMLEWNRGEGTIGEWDPANVIYEKGEAIDLGYDATDPETNKSYNLSFSQSKKTLICNEVQALSGEHNFLVFDKKTGVPIRDASVIFRCGNYKACNLGTTDKIGHFSSKLPLCVGAGMVIEAEGYATYVIPSLNISINESHDYEIQMLKYKEMMATATTIMTSVVENAKTITVNARDQVWRMAKPIEDQESVIINIIREKENIYDPDFTQFVMLEGEDYSQIKLIPGRYQVQATLIDNDGAYIPKRHEFIGDKRVDYPAVNMTPAMLGSAIIDPATGLWHVSESDLEKNSIEFHLFKIKKPRKIEDLENMQLLSEFSSRYRAVIEPEFR